MKQSQSIVDSLQELALRASQHINNTVPAIIVERLCSEGEESPGSLSLTECHVINAIGTIDHITASEIARQVGLTRGGVSKIVARLQAKGYVFDSPRQDNKKERDLSLTALGHKAFSIHRELHEANLQRWESILCDYDEDEVELLDSMLKRMLDEFAE